MRLSVYLTNTITNGISADVLFSNRIFTQIVTLPGSASRNNFRTASLDSEINSE